LIILPHPD